MDIFSEFLRTTGFASMTLGNLIMILIGIVFIALAIMKDYEPLLLVPIGMGAIVGNIPVIDGMSLSVYDSQSWVVDESGQIQYVAGSVLSYLYIGVSQGIYPPLIFLGIGAMTDFSTMLSNPKLVLLGAAAQVGVFLTFLGAIWLSFSFEEAGRSESSAVPTGQRPSSWPPSWRRSCSERSRSRPTPTWLWFRSSSHRSCGC